MNPLTNVRNITKLNEEEQKFGIDIKKSWHNLYKDSAWIFVGGLNFDLSEGDIICVFSQYGEVVNINLIRDKKTGKSKGFCFLCYEDQRSTILAVDNLNGIKLLNRIIRVDHCANYKPPKEFDDTDEMTKKLYREGCAPEVLSEIKSEDKEEDRVNVKVEKKSERKSKRRKSPTDSSDSESSGSSSDSSSESTSSKSSASSYSKRKRKSVKKKREKSEYRDKSKKHSRRDKYKRDDNKSLGSKSKRRKEHKRRDKEEK